MSVCPECHPHIHTPEGCTGPPSPSDLWAGVSVEGCDCAWDSRPIPPGRPEEATMKPYPLMPGVPAAGHVTGSGFWHPGKADGCAKCGLNYDPRRHGFRHEDGRLCFWREKPLDRGQYGWLFYTAAESRLCWREHPEVR